LIGADIFRIGADIFRIGADIFRMASYVNDNGYTAIDPTVFGHFSSFRPKPSDRSDQKG